MTLVCRVSGDPVLEDRHELGVDGKIDLDGKVGSVPCCGRLRGTTPGRCGLTVWIGEGDPAFPGQVHLMAQGSQFPLSLPQDLDLPHEDLGRGRKDFCFLLVVGLQLFRIFLDLGSELLRLAIASAAEVLAVAGIGGLELEPVDDDQLHAEQSRLVAVEDELPAYPAEVLRVALSEVANGLRVGFQPVQEPHQLNVSIGLLFELPASAGG